MDNLILFVNSFLSYLLVFIVAVAVIIVAVLIGVKLRKNKDSKAAVVESDNEWFWKKICSRGQS